MGPQGRDYYKILGVERTADAEEIRRAYRKLARQHHPDVNRSAEAEALFKELNEAYQVLSDPEKRATYDRFGRVDVADWSRGFGVDPFADIFEDFFGGFAGSRTRRGRKGPMPGADLKCELKLSFEEAVFGCGKEIEVSRRELCPECGGSGAEPGTQPVRCPECQGSGQVRRAQQSLFGSFISVTTCGRCQGEGEVINTPCKACRGERRLSRTRKLMVEVPAGVDEGTQLRLSGEGEAGLYGGPAGNLYVGLSVRRHPFFRREGYDIHLELPVTIVQASLGSEIKVPTLEGEEPLSIPPGTQSGAAFRLKGKGIPRLGSAGRGEEVVTVRVVVPRRLSPEQANLLRKLGESLGADAELKDYKSFFDRMRDAMGR